MADEQILTDPQDVTKEAEPTAEVVEPTPPEPTPPEPVVVVEEPAVVVEPVQEDPVVAVFVGKVQSVRDEILALPANQADIDHLIFHLDRLRREDK